MDVSRTAARSSTQDTIVAGPADPLEVFDDPQFFVDPYPFYERLRALAPIHASSRGWTAVNYDDCREMLMSPLTRQPDPTEWQPAVDLPGTELLQQTLREWIGLSNPPEHQRRRGACDHAFSAKAVRALREVVQASVDELIDDVEGRGEMDLVADYSFLLPSGVMCSLLGMPKEDRELTRQWSEAISATYDPMVDEAAMRGGIDAARSVHDYFGALLADRRRRSADDLLSELARFEGGPEGLSTSEIESNALLMFLAGHRTTSAVIAGGFAELLEDRNRDQVALLQAQPAHARSATDEFLRFAGSAHAVWRAAAEDIPIGDQVIPAGSRLIPFLAAGSRDPRVYDDPARFDVTRRQPRPHLAFGAGSHYCLGAQLARLEIEVSIDTLLSRLPTLRLEEHDPPMSGGVVSRGPERLPVSFGASSSTG